MLCVCVEDHGPGIPPEQRERIFERFARAAGAEARAGGAGRSLSLAAERVKAHSGRGCSEEVEGGGAHFVAEFLQVLSCAGVALHQSLPSPRPRGLRSRQRR